MAWEGLGKGLVLAGQSFNEGYDAAARRELERQRMAQDKAMRDRAMKFDLAAKKMVETPTGEFELSDAGKASEQFERGSKSAGLLKEGIELDPLTGEVKIAPWRQNLTQAEIDVKRASAGKLRSDIEKDRAKKDQPPTNKEIFNNLPPENQEQITLLSKEKAKKLNSFNKFDEVLKIMDDKSVSEEQKIQQAYSTLKQLNDPENSDALAREEAGRASKFLEYNIIPNLTEPGAVLGRDLKGFRDQLVLSKQKLKGASDANDKQINELYGGSRSSGQGLLIEGNAGPGTLKVGDVQDGYTYKGGDPSNPNSWSKK